MCHCRATLCPKCEQQYYALAHRGRYRRYETGVFALCSKSKKGSRKGPQVRSSRRR